MHLGKNNVEGPMGISIVVPVYNKEKYISRILGDISNQSFEDFQRTRPVKFAMSLLRRISDSASGMFQTAAYLVRGISALQERLGNTLPS